MARKTLSEQRKEKLAELERIKEDLAEIESRAAERIGKLAVKVGLADIDVPDDVLKKELEAIASRFRGKSVKPSTANTGKAGEG